MKFPYTHKSAEFSKDKKKRLWLYRSWSKKEYSEKHAMVIGLNPSTADESEDDPTIGFVTRVLDFNGYEAFTMVNLFTMITPYPKELIMDDSLEEAMQIWKIQSRNSDVVFAWGRFKTLNRDLMAKEMFHEAFCFARTKDGSPRHPMYLKENTQLIKFNP